MQNADPAFYDLRTVYFASRAAHNLDFVMVGPPSDHLRRSFWYPASHDFLAPNFVKNLAPRSSHFVEDVDSAHDS